MLKEGGGLKAAIGPDGTLSYFEKRKRAFEANAAHVRLHVQTRIKK